MAKLDKCPICDHEFNEEEKQLQICSECDWPVKSDDEFLLSDFINNDE